MHVERADLVALRNCALNAVLFPHQRRDACERRSIEHEIGAQNHRLILPNPFLGESELKHVGSLRIVRPSDNIG